MGGVLIEVGWLSFGLVGELYTMDVLYLELGLLSWISFHRIAFAASLLSAIVVQSITLLSKRLSKPSYQLDNHIISCTSFTPRQLFSPV